MNAIYLIAHCAMLVSAEACFYGESKHHTETSLIPRDTPENRAGVSAQTQCPCGFQAVVTHVTPVTPKKIGVEVKTAKRSLKWASAT